MGVQKIFLEWGEIPHTKLIIYLPEFIFYILYMWLESEKKGEYNCGIISCE